MYKLIGEITKENHGEILASFIKACKRKQVIIITSEKPRVGKTSTVQALLDEFAKTDKKLLVIDADNRKSGSLFGSKAMDSGEPYTLNSVTHMDGYDALYCGRIGRRSTNLLADIEKFGEFINSARDVYDYILIDTPPYMMFPEVDRISPFADGAVLVRNEENGKEPGAHLQKCEVIGYIKTNVERIVPYQRRVHPWQGRK